LDLHKATDED